MKNKMKILVFGILIFFGATLFVVVVGYLRCLISGITFNFYIFFTSGMRGGALLGFLAVFLMLIGAPRPRSPH